MSKEPINLAEIPALFEKATLNKASGNIELARNTCKAILELVENHAQTIHLLGLIELDAKNIQLACELIEKSVRIESNNSLFLNNLSIVYLELKNFDLALNAINKAIKLTPTNPEILVLKGVTRERQNKIAEAEDAYRNVLKVKPDHLHATSRLAHTLFRQKKYEGAADIVREAIKISPKDTSNNILLGKILLKLNMPAEAIPKLIKIVKDDVSNVAAVTVLAECFLRLRKPIDAIEVLKKGVAHTPSSVILLNNMGHVLRDLEKLEESLFFLDKAIKIDPDNVNANVNKGLSLLSLGHFGKAWQPYSMRSHQEDIKRNRPPTDLKCWSGQTLKNKNLFVWTEQGLGDQILQASLIQDLSKNTNKLILACSERLVSLFSYSFPSVQVISMSNTESVEGAGNMELCTPLLNLAKVLRPSLNSFPSCSGYINAQKPAVQKLRKRYLRGTEKNQKPIIIGISWKSSNPLYGEQNTIPLEHWKPIFQTSKISKRPIIFICCQYEVNKDELAKICQDNSVNILLDESVDQTGNLINIAAQLSAVDLVISTSTTTVQLAAALGRKTWHMPATGLACGWYWLSKSRSTPWYPTMRNFRRERSQSKIHQITAVAEALKKELLN